MFRSTYDVTPYNTYESDADLSHLIGIISNAKREFVFTIFTSGPTGAPGIAYIHTDAPKTYHPSPKTAQQLQQLGQINVNSNSHYMAQNPFLVNQETPAPSTAHRFQKIISCFLTWTSFFAATFSLEPQSRLLAAWREISIRWTPVICGDTALDHC